MFPKHDKHITNLKHLSHWSMSTVNQNHCQGTQSHEASTNPSICCTAHHVSFLGDLPPTKLKTQLHLPQRVLRTLHHVTEALSCWLREAQQAAPGQVVPATLKVPRLPWLKRRWNRILVQKLFFFWSCMLMFHKSHSWMALSEGSRFMFDFSHLEADIFPMEKNTYT